jgi:hypothetical protein
MAWNRGRPRLHLRAGPADRQQPHFASGLRNPVGLAWEPVTGALWTVVNERDGLGDETPPDYLTSVQDGGFYGWPYCYWGRTVDDRVPQDAAGVAGGQRADARLRAGRPHRLAGPVLDAGRHLPGFGQTAWPSASTARGTAARSAATRWCSCRSPNGRPAGRRATSCRASWRRTNRCPTAARWAWCWAPVAAAGGRRRGRRGLARWQVLLHLLQRAGQLVPAADLLDAV